MAKIINMAKRVKEKQDDTLDEATKVRLERYRIRSEKEVAEKKQAKESKRRKFFDAL